MLLNGYTNTGITYIEMLLFRTLRALPAFNKEFIAYFAIVYYITVKLIWESEKVLLMGSWKTRNHEQISEFDCCRI